jgi:hypothetical protein
VAGAPVLILRWGYCPPEVRRSLAPLLRSYLWLVPGWCRQLGVGFQADGDGADASTSCDPEYRQAWIRFHSGWLDANPTQRRLEVIHEVLHIALAPMSGEQREAVDRLFDDGDAPKYKATLQEQWRKAFEGTVQDIAFAVLAIPPAALPVANVVEEEDEHPPLEAVA